MYYHIIDFYLKIFNQFIFSLYSVYLCIFTTNLLFFQTPVLSKIQHSIRQISHSHTNVCHTTRGVTLPSLLALHRLHNFYSHAHEGRDLWFCKPDTWFDISTHTPTRGVTRHHLPTVITLSNFYSHAHEGRDVFLSM